MFAQISFLFVDLNETFFSSMAFLIFFLGQGFGRNATAAAEHAQ